MSGTFSVSLSEALGAATPADIDHTAVVIACSSGGTVSALNGFYLSGTAAQTGVGYGDGSDTLCQIIEQPQKGGGSGKKFPAAMWITPATTPGSYGAVDNTGVTGTAQFAVDATSAPRGTHEARIKMITGGTVGVAGMTFQWSLDGGRNWSNTIALGTADNYTIPNSGVKFVITPSSTDLTALNTLINEEFTKLNAHVVLTTGTVHSNADNADVVSAGTYPSATNTATRVARINAICAAYELHRVKGSGGSPAVHINVAGDITDGLAILTPAVDDETALARALDFKTKFNLHLANTTVHTIADATNPIASPAPVSGTLVNGDIAKVRTLAPKPSTSDVDAAFVGLAAASADFSIVICDFPCDAAMMAHLTTGANVLKAVGKRVTIIFRTRIPDAETSETDATWNTAISADFASATDSRIVKRATYELVTDAMTSRQYLRSDLAQFAADVVRSKRFEWPGCPADPVTGMGGISNVSLVDATGATIGHDEGPRGATTGLSDPTLGNTFSCVQRFPDQSTREAVFNTVPWVSFASGERIQNLMTRRLVNAMERIAVSTAISQLGSRLFYTSTGPTTGTLTPQSLKLAHGKLFAALSQEFSSEIDNGTDAALDTGLVQVSPTVTVSGGNLLGLAVTLAPKVGGFVLSWTLTIAVQE